MAILHLLGRKRELISGLRRGYEVYCGDPELHNDFIPFAKRLGFSHGDLERLILENAPARITPP
jgi:hypothetical protein